MDTFRKTQRQLAESEKELIDNIKDRAQILHTSLEHAHNTGADGRCIALAKTKLEEAVMWAVKGITG